MNRSAVAAGVVITALAVLGTGGCTSPGGSGAGPATSVAPQPVSACRSTPTTGDTSAIIDWVDFVQLGGVQYYAGFDGQLPPVPTEQLGATVGLVECRLSDLHFDGLPGLPVDGDAAFIPIGTPVRAIRGFDPACRVTARVDGVNRVYLAHEDVKGVTRAVPCAKAAPASSGR
ncbi:hypothetical protein [Terrabacter sp. 2RAF25]|uniref:hypothetical protein n=1 Tax=Terrabacter sp. 2RAF25 TaxID=3232998 RepID=UPI003F9DBC67